MLHTVNLEPGESRTELRDRALAMLNQLVEADQRAIHNLIEFRQPVNNAVENLDSDVVLISEDSAPDTWLLGVLGLINGLLGPSTKICGCFRDDGQLFKFTPVPSEEK